MLKQWLVSDGSVDSITVEEKYSQWVEQLRSDKYVTVLGLQTDFTPWFGLSHYASYTVMVSKKKLSSLGYEIPALQTLWQVKGGKGVRQRTVQGLLGYIQKPTIAKLNKFPRGAYTATSEAKLEFPILSAPTLRAPRCIRSSKRSWKQPQQDLDHSWSWAQEEGCVMRISSLWLQSNWGLPWVSWRDSPKWIWRQEESLVKNPRRRNLLRRLPSRKPKHWQTSFLSTAILKFGWCLVYGSKDSHNRLWWSPDGHLRYKKAINDIPSCLTQIKDLEVRNSDDLEPWLQLPIESYNIAYVDISWYLNRSWSSMIDHPIWLHLWNQYYLSWSIYILYVCFGIQPRSWCWRLMRSPSLPYLMLPMKRQILRYQRLFLMTFILSLSHASPFWQLWKLTSGMPSVESRWSRRRSQRRRPSLLEAVPVMGRVRMDLGLVLVAIEYQLIIRFVICFIDMLHIPTTVEDKNNQWFLLRYPCHWMVCHGHGNDAYGTPALTNCVQYDCHFHSGFNFSNEISVKPCSCRVGQFAFLVPILGIYII